MLWLEARLMINLWDGSNSSKWQRGCKRFGWLSLHVSDCEIKARILWSTSSGNCGFSYNVTQLCCRQAQNMTEDMIRSCFLASSVAVFIPKRLKNKNKTSCFIEFATVVEQINKAFIALLGEKATFDSRIKAVWNFYAVELCHLHSLGWMSQNPLNLV